MSNFWTGYGFGGAFGASRLGRRIIKPALKLFIVVIIIAGLIYAFVIFKAVNQRSQPRHVHPHSS
jgi:flagellar basal body-associated protein FliL